MRHDDFAQDAARSFAQARHFNPADTPGGTVQPDLGFCSHQPRRDQGHLRHWGWGKVQRLRTRIPIARAVKSFASASRCVVRHSAARFSRH